MCRAHKRAAAQGSLRVECRPCRAAQLLGDRVLRPFLQDTIQFWPLSAAMAGTLFLAPLTIARVLPQA